MADRRHWNTDILRLPSFNGFLDWKCLYFDLHFTKWFHKGPTENKWALVQIISSSRTGNKPFSWATVVWWLGAPTAVFGWVACFEYLAWWRHQMETFSALLAICAGNSPVPGEFPSQRPVTWSFDVYCDLRPNKRLSKQSWGWWFETFGLDPENFSHDSPSSFRWDVKLRSLLPGALCLGE